MLVLKRVDRCLNPDYEHDSVGLVPILRNYDDW